MRKDQGHSEANNITLIRAIATRWEKIANCRPVTASSWVWDIRLPLPRLFPRRLLSYKILCRNLSTYVPKSLFCRFYCTVSLERWCRLRGNLLFYFKSREQWSEPLGVIILEQCTVRTEPPSNHVPFGFSIGKYYRPRNVPSSHGCIDDLACRRLHACTPCWRAASRSETTPKAQKEKCYSFRRRLVSTVRRQHGRGTGQLVAGAATGQLRVHAEPIIVAATAHRGVQRTQARHWHSNVATAAWNIHRLGQS